MTTLTIKIPDGKKTDVATYIKNMGGEIVITNKKTEPAIDDEDEVTHESYFGENIRRVIKAFKS